MDPSVYVRTLIYHFSEGGRHIEDTRQTKSDEGFRSLIDPGRMPGPDAIGDWLRRMGSGGGQEALQCCNDMVVRRYLKKARTQDGKKEATDGEDLGSEEAGGKELTLDVNATIIEADKGVTAYDGTSSPPKRCSKATKGRFRSNGASAF